MPSKPSRSEIESAVAANRRPVARRKKNSASGHATTTHRMHSRRQQKIIGGDLSGVSNNTFSGRFLSKFRKINSVNWIAIAIVLAIFAVFFSPQPENQQTIEIAAQAEEAVESVYSDESRIDPAPVVQDQQSFIRNTDLDRANVFRDQEILDRKVAILLADAKAHMAKNEFSLPKGNNALLAYNAILQLDPRNRTALSGIQTINETYLEKGYLALTRNAVSAAEIVLEKLSFINEQSNETLEFADALNSWKTTQKINTLLAKAKQAMALDNLILPARENALYFYQQILLIDEANVTALKGIQSISNTYINKTNTAISGGEYEAATGFLATVSVIDPNNPSISLLAKTITKATAIAGQKQLAKRKLRNKNKARESSPTYHKKQAPQTSLSSR